MYFNNIHILIYVAIFIVGLFIGKIVAWCYTRIPEKKKIFSKDFFEEDKKGLKYNYTFMIITGAIYALLLYHFGINKTGILQNLELIKFLILLPMLILALAIDAKHRIIPNRLTLTILEVGLIITFIYGITNVNMAKEYILGMLAGGAIFAFVTLLGGLIFGKEAMGMGDIKFTAAMGLFFGTYSIAEISILAFFIAAIYSIFVLIIRLIFRNKDEYIPFGPFLSISAMICIITPAGMVFDNFLLICQMISERIPII